MSSNQDKLFKKNKKQLRVRKKERTRKAILTAAEKFFSEKPMNEVSLEDIAESAFVSRTTVYNYFKNKDEIFFGLGTQTFKEANELIENNFPSDLPGNEQVFKLCERSFRAGTERPVILAIIREFFKRINYSNISMEKLYIEIADSRGTNKFKDLIENYEEPYLIEFYLQLLKNTDLWIRAVRNGKIDNTIRIDLEDVQIVQFLYMLISGMVEEIELRKSTLNRIRLDRETVTRNSLNLIAIFLKNESKIQK